MSGIVSMKADVFSFGVLLLEIVSGRKNNSCYDTERPLNLVGYVSIQSNYRSFLYCLSNILYWVLKFYTFRPGSCGMKVKV